jgi:hypothetical protein
MGSRPLGTNLLTPAALTASARATCGSALVGITQLLTMPLLWSFLKINTSGAVEASINDLDFGAVQAPKFRLVDQCVPDEVSNILLCVC